MGNRIDFIKGHMGGNKILILDGSQIHKENVLQTALFALDELALSGHQAGILYPPERGGTVRVRIVSVCGRDFIGACGGLSQVLSRALIETDLGEKYRPRYEKESCRIKLEFDQIDVDVDVMVNDKAFSGAFVDFTSFAREIFLRGVEKVKLGEIDTWRIGHFFVVNCDKVKIAHPEANFELMDGITREIITLLQYRFLGATGITSWDSAFYDHNSSNDCDLRVFFPHNVRINYIEPSCGTGSIALALALLANGEADEYGQISENNYNVKLETGGKPVLGGPDQTIVKIDKFENKVQRTFFSNNNVQLLASGTLEI